MDADDRTGPSYWVATSLKQFDQLARGMLRAARSAARELRRDPPDPDRRTEALGLLAGQTQAMLGHDRPAHPPVGAAAQSAFVCTSLQLAVHALAHRWSETDLGLAGQAEVPHLGERQTADAFDVLGRLMLPHASPEGWTAAVFTDLARGDEAWEAAVKLGKYILHPTFLALADDATRVVGEAVHHIHVDRLQALVDSVRHFACAAVPPPPAMPWVVRAPDGEPEPDVPVMKPWVVRAPDGEPEPDVPVRVALADFAGGDETVNQKVRLAVESDDMSIDDPHLRDRGPIGL
ncbi:hypothetical protein [Streptomyces sp. NPDC002156]